MLYFLLKKIFQLAFKIYFRETKIHYAVPLDPSKPTLFVSNHQSGVMDAILVSSQVSQNLHFMSRGESFGNRFKRWLYGLINMHPIYRKEFTPEKVHLNDIMMPKFSDILASGDSLLIFPEGVSRTEPRMRKIKTGAARVVLATEALNQYGLDVQLVPIGINYSDPHQFRSDVQINFGAPINLSEAMDLHRRNEEWQAVQKLTTQIEQSIKALTIEVTHPELDDIVYSVDQICREEFLHAHVADCYQEELKVRQEMVAAIGYYHQSAPSIFEKMQKKLSGYRLQLERTGLSEQRLQRLFKTQGWQILLHLLACPIHLYSFVNAAGILLGSHGLTTVFLKRPDFKGSLQLGFGVLCGFLFLPLQIILCYYFSASIGIGIGYTFSLLLSFSFSLHHFNGLKVLRSWAALTLGPFEHWATIGLLARRREVLLKELKMFWRRYHQEIQLSEN